MEDFEGGLGQKSVLGVFGGILFSDQGVRNQRKVHRHKHIWLEHVRAQV